MSDTKKLVLIISDNTNTDKSTVALTIANAALASGTKVGIFLTSDGVELAREGGYDLTAVKPFKPAAELMDNFLSGGGVLWTCAPCFQHRGLKDEETVEGAIVIGAGPMLEWVAEGASTITI